MGLGSCVSAIRHRNDELDGAQAHGIATKYAAPHGRGRDVGVGQGVPLCAWGSPAPGCDPQIGLALREFKAGYAVIVIATPRLGASALAATWPMYLPMQLDACHRARSGLPRITVDELVGDQARSGAQLPGQLDRASAHGIAAVNQQTQRTRHDPYRPCDGARCPTSMI